MEIKENKSQVRSRMRALKKSMTAAQIEENSRTICERLRRIPQYSEKDRLFIYVNYNQEVATIPLIKAEIALGAKEVLIPKVCGERSMHFYAIRDFDNELTPGAYGIPEPSGLNYINDDEINDENSVIILPGLAFDEEFNRIGYGGGYYDTFLQKHDKMLKIAVCHDFQIIDKCPQMEPTDIKADIIISEKRVFSRI